MREGEILVQAVERIKATLQARIANELELVEGDDTFSSPAQVTSVAIDWFLWSEGEKARDDSPTPHHRTMTVYY